MKNKIFFFAILAGAFATNLSAQQTYSDEEICTAVIVYLNEFNNSNYSGYLGNKKDSFQSGNDYVYSYFSNNPFPGAKESIIHDPFMKTVNPYRYAEIILAEMAAQNGKVDEALFRKYQDTYSLLKKCLEPNGFEFHCHDADDYGLYKYRTTLSLAINNQSNSPFSSMQSNNKLTVEVYIDKSNSEANVKDSYKLILLIKVV